MARRFAGLVAADHTFAVPLDHARPGQNITVYGREVRLADGRDRPWLVYLTGGPGHQALRPLDGSGWLGRAVRDFTVLLLDQRGTGRSTRASRQTLAHLAPAAQAEYLSHFRADAIVADCEMIRRRLTGGDRWTVLGQSFGGFCATTYLSFAPDGLDRALITGGLPPLEAPADEIYRTMYRKVLDRNAAFYDRYPDDEPRVAAIRDHLMAAEVRLPGGDVLGVRRFQGLGISLGAADGYERMHYLVEDAWVEPGVLADAFLAEVEQATSFLTHPLYALLHEPAYCQGTAAAWAAERTIAEVPQMRADHDRFHFTGEMIYPWMFDDQAVLRPLREAAHLLAAKADWPALYDVEALGRNEIPVAAALYYDDYYVAREFSTQTAAQIRGARVWITNEHEHDGLRRAGADILDRLLGMT